MDRQPRQPAQQSARKIGIEKWLSSFLREQNVLGKDTRRRAPETKKAGLDSQNGGRAGWTLRRRVDLKERKLACEPRRWSDIVDHSRCRRKRHKVRSEERRVGKEGKRR